MIDAYELWQLDKSKPLKIGEYGGQRELTCCLCDGPIGGHGSVQWVVSIPRHGRAHTHCAQDHGWTVQ